MRQFQEYEVWRQSHIDVQWSKTSHVVKARTEKEAASRIKRMFNGCGLSHMSLVPFPKGTDPAIKKG